MPYFRFTKNSSRLEDTQTSAPLWEARTEFKQAGVFVAAACKLGQALLALAWSQVMLSASWQW